MQVKIPDRRFLGLGLLPLVLFLLTACTTENSELTHSVQPGETRQIIADKYNTVPELVVSNTPEHAPLPDDLQSVTIVAVQPKPAPPIGPDSPGFTYTVVEGDTYDTIVQKFKSQGYQVGDLKKVNNITNTNFIRTGQILTIPIVLPPTPRTCQYTVRLNDNIAGIARKYNVSEGNIREQNLIPNPQAIVVGQVLNITLSKVGIPCPNPDAPAGSAPPAKPQQGGGDSISNTDGLTEVYTVQSGDTLWTIAARYGTTVDILVKDNRISNRNLIRPGQRLVLRKK